MPGCLLVIVVAGGQRIGRSELRRRMAEQRAAGQC
jgi:hypothetical protein